MDIMQQLIIILLAKQECNNKKLQIQKFKNKVKEGLDKN